MFAWTQRLSKKKKASGIRGISPAKPSAYHPKPVYRRDKSNELSRNQAVEASSSTSTAQTMQSPQTIYGGGTLGRGITDDNVVSEILDALEAGGVKKIDTAQLYPGSEELLGKVKAGARFTIDTKTKGGFLGEADSGTREDVVASGNQSLKKLGLDKVDVYYIHAPSAAVPISSTLAGIQDLYLAGAFSRFGLSNYTAEGVLEVYNYCKEHGYVLPTVYQGNYSAVARKQETVLFPTLRKLGIAFYAYSPVAGGFLTKTREQVLEGTGRWAPPGSGGPGGGLYHDLYVKPSYLNALDEWGRIADDVGCSRAELAYRWVKYSSALKAELGDAIIFGGSSVGQVKETLKGMEAGPLKEEAVKSIEEIWKLIEHDAPLDNYNSFVAKGGNIR